MNVTSPSRGFTLLELMATLAVAGVLAALAIPSFSSWIANTKVRTSAQSIGSNLRFAQAEALKRSRGVVLYRTASSTCAINASPSATGAYWVMQTIPYVSVETAAIVQCNTVADFTANVDVSSAAVGSGTLPICFNGSGRLAAVTDPGLGGAACTVDANGTRQFNVRLNPQSNRPLRVLATLGGSVRLCDPAKTFSATDPDGCPP